MGLRCRGVCGAQSAHCREFQAANGGARRDFLGSGTNGRDIARCPLLQQEFRGLDDRLGVKSGAHLCVQESVGDSDHGHALMVCHEGANDRAIFALGQT
jgi:hypothetical protein